MLDARYPNRGCGGYVVSTYGTLVESTYLHRRDRCWMAQTGTISQLSTMVAAAQHPPRCRASITTLVFLPLLYILYYHVSIVAATRHHDESNQIIDQFTPPKLSFTASEVNSIQDESLVVTSDSNTSNDSKAEVTWTIFQAVSSLTAKEAILRRSGPLLTLFPKSNDMMISKSNFNYYHMMHSHQHAVHSVHTPSEQRLYLERHGKQCHSGDILSRYDLFVKSSTLSNLAIELWKYCALYVEGGVYVDAETAPLVALGDVLGWENSQPPNGYDATATSNNAMKNYAVVASTRDSGVSPRLISTNSSISNAVTAATSHGTGNPIAISSMLAISTKQHSVPERMIGTLMLTATDLLESDALLLPKALMSFISEDNNARIGDDDTTATPKWGLLKQRCHGIEIAPAGHGNGQPRTLRHCPPSSGYCCEILDPTSRFVFLLSRQSLVPNQLLPSSSKLPRPYAENQNNSSGTSAINAVVPEKEVAFLSTIREDPSSQLLQSSSSTLRYTPGNSDTTPNIYELLSRENALPNQEKNKQACMDCLREKKAANCALCSEKCPKFCSRLCELSKSEKPVKRVLSVVGPKYRKDPERWIPRIIHQVRLLFIFFFCHGLNCIKSSCKCSTIQ
jgi:hypothetical protein